MVPVLFEHSLKDTETEDHRVGSLDHIFSVEPMKIRSPSTDAEVALALRVLEGCCLLHPESTIFAHQHKAIPVILHILLRKYEGLPGFRFRFALLLKLWTALMSHSSFDEK